MTFTGWVRTARYSLPRLRTPRFRAAPITIGRAVLRAPGRMARWLLADPRRMLTVLWLAGLLMVGTTHVAAADILDGPDLAGGAPKTLYETYDYADYKLMVKPDDEHSDWFGLSQGVLEVVGFINTMLLWMCLGLVYGALALLSWFLNLTIYQDVSSEIDAATRMIANQVFWPLVSATVAVAAFIAYARWRGEGRGVISEIGWIVAAAALAMGFAAGPSTVMTQVDGVRQDLAAGVMTASSQYAETRANPTGFPTPAIEGDRQVVGTRKLVDNMWSIYGATTWCRAMFRSPEVCQKVGHHALANDEQWQTWMSTLDAGGAPPEFGEYVHYMRGQDLTRTGYLLVLAFITVPLAILLLRLVIAGLMTVIGFLLLLVAGMVFLTCLPIRGPLRQAGIRHLAMTLGMQIQGLLVTVLISATMVVSVITSTRANEYGFLALAVINLILIGTAVRVHAYFETIAFLPGGSAATGYATMLVLRSATRTMVRAGTGTISGVARGTGRAMGQLTRPIPRLGGPSFADKGNWRRARFPGTPRASTAAKASRLDTAPPNPRQQQQRPLPGTRRPIVYGLPSSGTSPGPSGPGGPPGGGPGGPARPRGSAPGFPRPSSGGGGGEAAPRVVPGSVASVVTSPTTGSTGSAASTPRTSATSAGGPSRVWVHKKGQGISPVDPGAALKPGSVSPKLAPPQRMSPSPGASAPRTRWVRRRRTRNRPPEPPTGNTP